MNNPYQTTVNPYMVGNPQMQPMANDMQAMQHQQLLRQQEALVGQAGQTQGGGGNMGQMMADALRESSNGSPGKDMKNTVSVGLGNKYNTNPLSEQSRMLAMQERGLYR